MTDLILKHKICIECYCGKDLKCPKDPKQYSNIAFCFIHENIEHPNNFKPHACQSPKRVNHEKHLEKKCGYFGLSFYTNLDMAKSFHAHLEKSTKGKFGKVNGTLLATVCISKEDGVYDEIDNKTHFNFFEFYTTNLFAKIEKTEQI